MATVADTLLKIDGTAATGVVITFELYEQAKAESAYVTSRSRVLKTTHATTGAFSTTLMAGSYRVRWKEGSEYNEILITVPSGSSTYNFQQILT